MWASKRGGRGEVPYTPAGLGSVSLIGRAGALNNSVVPDPTSLTQISSANPSLFVDLLKLSG